MMEYGIGVGLDVESREDIETRERCTPWQPPTGCPTNESDHDAHTFIIQNGISTINANYFAL